MRPADYNLAEEIRQNLSDFDKSVKSLEGIRINANLTAFVEQVVDSIRRINYITTIRDKNFSQFYTNPQNIYFDPLKAASWYRQNGNTNEAFWLIFLAIHCGKNKKTNWELVRRIYHGNGHIWNWQAITMNFTQFRTWLQLNIDQISSSGKFGNHRKYQSLNAFSSTGTGMAISSYIDWVGPASDHESFFNAAIQLIGNNPRDLFNFLYKSMSAVVSFGRTAKFDYLTMVGKMGLLSIEPDSTYMHGATGPKSGARLLFYNNVKANATEAELNILLHQLEAKLGLYYGMQVLEDSLCNWQKRPDEYVHFSG